MLGLRPALDIGGLRLDVGDPHRLDLFVQLQPAIPLTGRHVELPRVLAKFLGVQSEATLPEAQLPLVNGVALIGLSRVFGQLGDRLFVALIQFLLGELLADDFKEGFRPAC